MSVAVISSESDNQATIEIDKRASCDIDNKADLQRQTNDPLTTLCIALLALSVKRHLHHQRFASQWLFAMPISFADAWHSCPQLSDELLFTHICIAVLVCRVRGTTLS